MVKYKRVYLENNTLFKAVIWLRSVETFEHNSILLTGLELSYTVREVIGPWHWFLIDFHVIRNYTQKFVLPLVSIPTVCPQKKLF